MKKRIIFFYGINLLVTLFLAMVFGGILGSIKGNELILGLFVSTGVQLSPFVTTLIYRKKYKEKKEYTYDINKWTIISVIVPIILITISTLILSLLDIKYIETGYTGTILIAAILTTLIGSYTEEIGWRGCFLNIFETTYSKFTSSLLVGLLWGLWHFFIISSVGIMGYLLFVPTIIGFSILMTYIYHKSNNSMTNMILFHAFINLTNLLLLFNRECKEFYIILCVIELLILLIIYLKDKEYFKIKS